MSEKHDTIDRAITVGMSMPYSLFIQLRAASEKTNLPVSTIVKWSLWHYLEEDTLSLDMGIRNSE